MDFIERIFGVSPDAGSGALELALVALSVICVALLAAYRRFRRSNMFSQRTKKRAFDRPSSACGCAEGSVGFLIGGSAVLLAYVLRSGWSVWEAGAACVLPFALLAGGQRLGRARSRS